MHEAALEPPYARPNADYGPRVESGELGRVVVLTNIPCHASSNFDRLTDSDSRFSVLSAALSILISFDLPSSEQLHISLYMENPDTLC